MVGWFLILIKGLCSGMSIESTLQAKKWNLMPRWTMFSLDCTIDFEVLLFSRTSIGIKITIPGNMMLGKG